ncbi:TetR/AcrR family transcriptional regulator [Streptomyces sp. NPDC006602]|uniref:TetR/AcrR family transcriptional regulator n=1 Tax=Streptomyces sp. NPDC006602 TaxID=3364751 RepID=UPI003692823C
MTSELSLRQRKKLATRSALSHAAWSLMAEQGLDAAPPEAVAEAANGAPRTFRNYFGSREKAILHGLVSRGTILVDTMRARPAEEPGWDSLVKVLPAFTATFAVQRDDIAVLMRAVAENPAMRAQHFVAHEDAHQRLAEFIADRTGTDVERDLAPRLLAATAAAVLRTSVEIGARGETGATLPDLVREGLAQLRDSLPVGAGGTTAHRSGVRPQGVRTIPKAPDEETT